MRRTNFQACRGCSLTNLAENERECLQRRLRHFRLRLLARKSGIDPPGLVTILSKHLSYHQSLGSQNIFFHAVSSDFRLFLTHHAGIKPGCEPHGLELSVVQRAVQRLVRRLRKYRQNRIIWLYFVCFQIMCAETCRAPVMRSIVLLIVLLCFQVKLDWFNFAARDGHMSRSVGRPTIAPRTLPELWRPSDGVLQNLWAPCHCGKTP